MIAVTAGIGWHCGLGAPCQQLHIKDSHRMPLQHPVCHDSTLYQISNFIMEVKQIKNKKSKKKKRGKVRMRQKKAERKLADMTEKKRRGRERNIMCRNKEESGR